MSEMVERVKAAIDRGLRDAGCYIVDDAGQQPTPAEVQPFLREAARAAIEAMREPTVEMMIAGENLASDIATTDDRIEVPASIEITWPAMIDAALKD